ncbi:hypothetical protein NC651_007096 [Populus alba x Populus x berolinensis]|nr:hypothetical protein NC651_007096 [Populus alba x Populus x berolinensis]
MNRNLMSVARKALTKAYNPNSLTITNNLFLAGLSLSLSLSRPCFNCSGPSCLYRCDDTCPLADVDFCVFSRFVMVSWREVIRRCFLFLWRCLTEGTTTLANLSNLIGGDL